MMKSLAITLLILISAPVANAVYIQIDGNQTDYIEISEGTTSLITIVSENNSSWLGYLVIEDGGTGTLSNAIILDSAGNLASATSYTEVGWGSGYELITAMSPEGVPAIAAGMQFSIEYSGGIPGQMAQISLFIDPQFETPVSTVAVSIIPEPLTIALLGLGCLFLSRRK